MKEELVRRLIYRIIALLLAVALAVLGFVFNRTVTAFLGGLWLAFAGRELDDAIFGLIKDGKGAGYDGRNYDKSEK